MSPCSAILAHCVWKDSKFIKIRKIEQKRFLLKRSSGIKSPFCCFCTNFKHTSGVLVYWFEAMEDFSDVSNLIEYLALRACYDVMRFR